MVLLWMELSLQEQVIKFRTLSKLSQESRNSKSFRCTVSSVQWTGLNSQGQVFGHLCMKCLLSVKGKIGPYALPSLELHSLLCVIRN